MYAERECLLRAFSTCPTAVARNFCPALFSVPAVVTAAQDCSGRRRLRSAI